MRSDSKKPFIESLQEIVLLAKKDATISVRHVFQILAGKGYAALLILLSLPFCLPVQIPGFSTPFGLLLAFLGLRIAFAKKLWWPKWVLEKRLSSQHVQKVVDGAIKIVKKMQKLVKPRMKWVTKNHLAHRLSGLLVFFLALLLSLPLPIPMSNLFSAVPIFIIGIGLLEDDGVLLLTGYALAIVCFISFLWIFRFFLNLI